MSQIKRNTNKRRISEKNLGVTVGVLKAISSPRGKFALLVDRGRGHSGPSSELPNRVNYKQKKKNYRQKEKNIMSKHINTLTYRESILVIFLVEN